jgi:hypothetical protein
MMYMYKEENIQWLQSERFSGEKVIREQLLLVMYEKHPSGSAFPGTLRG